MNKTAMMACVVMTAGAISFAADANLMKYVEILPAQSPTLEKVDVLLLGPVANTNLGSTAGSAIDVSAYEGYGVIVMGQGARSADGDTSTVSIVYGFDSSPATALVTATQATATAKFTSYEFDFDTLQGTNDALYLKATFANVEGDDTAMVGDAVLVVESARASEQTITGSAVDVAAYKGNATFVFECGSPVNESAAFTNIVTIQHSANGSTAWATCTNLAGTAMVVTDTGATGQTATLPMDLSRLRKYVRAVSVQYNDVAPVGVTLVAPMKSE